MLRHVDKNVLLMSQFIIKSFHMMKISCGSISAKISQERISLSENYSGFAFDHNIRDINKFYTTGYTRRKSQIATGGDLTFSGGEFVVVAN